eukprot:2991870-Alexandrium_andersonii.AAC.1
MRPSVAALDHLRAALHPGGHAAPGILLSPAEVWPSMAGCLRVGASFAFRLRLSALARRLLG